MVTIANHYKASSEQRRTGSGKYIDSSTRTLDNGIPTAQYIYIPTKTEDYVIRRGSKSLGLYANRSIFEGETIFHNSLQFTLTDVEDGDYALFNTSKSLTEIQHKKEAYNVVPSRVPLESDLLFTHGIPVLSDDPTKTSSGIITHHVKVPAMLLNHSCDSNIIHDGGDDGHERHLATRDIRMGEELTIDYSLMYYNDGPIYHKCLCGSHNCVGQIVGFKDLDSDKQERLLPLASTAVRAMLMADLEIGKPVKYEQPLVAERVFQAPMFSALKGFRMVCPSPSSCLADIAVTFDSDDSYGLYALRDFEEGEVVYNFWETDWPMEGKVPIDMVFSTAMGPGDPVEGTSIWLDPKERGHKDSQGKLKFTGFDLLTQHSCDPNMKYEQTKQAEKDNWQTSYAARPIAKGEQLTVDYNSMLWDRSAGVKIATCSCKTDNCAGTVKGFRFLSNIKQKQRWVQRDNGRNLSPHVRQECKKYDGYYHDLIADYDFVPEDNHDYNSWDDSRDARDTDSRSGSGNYTTATSLTMDYSFERRIWR